MRDATLVRMPVRVDWVDLGEGLNGDYDPEDPDDIPVYRFDVYVFDQLGGEWEEAGDASYATNVSTETPYARLMELLEIIMDEIWEPASNGYSIKKICERLSWIGDDGEFLREEL